MIKHVAEFILMNASNTEEMKEINQTSKVMKNKILGQLKH